MNSILALIAILLVLPTAWGQEADPRAQDGICDTELTVGAAPVLMEPVGHRWRKTNWISKRKAAAQMGYSLAQISEKRRQILENLDLEKVSLDALDFVAASDPNWRLRRLALDMGARKLYKKIKYDWIGVLDGQIGNPLLKYLEGFGQAGAAWRRASVEIVLTMTEGRLLAQNVLVGRQSLGSWMIEQVEKLVAHVKWLGSSHPEVQYRPLTQLSPDKRIEAIDRIFHEFNQALQRSREMGTQFIPPPLGDQAFEALMWIAEHDPDALVRRHALDVVEQYQRFGKATFLSGVKVMPDAQNVIDMAQAFRRIGQTLPLQTQRFVDSQGNPFNDASLALPVKGVAKWNLPIADVSAHFRKPRVFETDEQWLDFIARLTMITNLAEPLVLQGTSKAPAMVAANDNYAAADLAKNEAERTPVMRDALIEFLREVAHFHPSAQVRLGAVVAAVQIGG